MAFHCLLIKRQEWSLLSGITVKFLKPQELSPSQFLKTYSSLKRGLQAQAVAAEAEHQGRPQLTLAELAVAVAALQFLYWMSFLAKLLLVRWGRVAQQACITELPQAPLMELLGAPHQ
jgi:hypothetical protein